MNPEREAMKHLGLRKAYERAKEVLSEDAINPETFRDLYGNTNVDNDLAYVKKRKANFEQNDSPEEQELLKLSKIFEAIVHQQAEMSNWLGESAHSIRPSEYDDIQNGVDSIVEFQESENKASHLALAIDVTFSRRVEEKLRSIKRDVEEGRLSRVKYFESEFMGFRGELTQVPRVVVGADQHAVSELVELWMSGGPRALADHPMQQQILREIAMQLEAFEAYARAKGQKETPAIYKNAGNIVKTIVAEKAKKGKILSDAEFSNDEVFEGIRVYLGNFR